MLEEAPILSDKARGLDWQARLRSSLGHCFPQIAETLTGSARELELQFQLVKAGARAVSLKVMASGYSGFIKVFDGVDGTECYGRERGTLLAMSDSGLVPDVLAYSDELQFVLTEWVWQDHGLEQDPCRVASVIGSWMARFDAAAPSEPASGNWLGYLSKIKTGLDHGPIGDMKDALVDIPLCGRVLSRNDAAFHNYIWSRDGSVLGCDFEQARMRPRGWDYIMGFSALIERFPDNISDVLTAYSEGFARSHRGSLIVEELNAVARVLFCARAVAGQRHEEVASWQ